LMTSSWPPAAISGRWPVRSATSVAQHLTFLAQWS
jgi:hypothetical protein